MIPVARLVGSVRYALKDMQGVNVSDFEIIEALNRAADLLFHRFAARWIYAGMKKTTLIVDEGDKSAVLPRDFQSVARIVDEDGYPCSVLAERIVGDELFAPEGAYGLEYYYLPADVEDLEDVLDAPESVTPWLENMTVAILNGDMAGAAQTAEACCAAMAAGEVTHFPATGPVSVLGGKL